MNRPALAHLDWQPITRAPRRLLVPCVCCGYSAVNESNRLHRAGWQETVSTPRRYRCGECATSGGEL